MNFTEKLQAASAGIASQILAANLATGEHDATLADAVSSLISGYHEDLPFDIRGVSSTEFTMVSDQTADFAIPHTLGVKPDFAFLWDVDDNGGQRINPANAGGVINAFLDTRSIWYGSTYGRTSTGTWNVWHAMNEYIVGFAAYAYATDKNCMFLYRGTGAKLRSGHTYRMIAVSVKRNAGYPTSKTRLQDYLYQLDYDEIDYATAYEYFKDLGDSLVGACSAVRSGDLFGRNFDWHYSNQAEFIVRTPSAYGRKAVVGTAGAFSALTKSFVDSDQPSALYKIVPFKLQDGVNEDGLAACYNVVPTDYDKQIAMPTGTQEVEICALMLVRYILDNFSDALTAAQYVREHCKVYFPTALHDMDYELHVMLADPNGTYVLEFVDGETKIIDVSDVPYMTNFHLYMVERNADGTVYTPATNTASLNAHDTNKITLHGAGLERYNLIVDQVDSISSMTDLRNLMNELLYTRAYITSPNAADPEWLSEYTDGNITVSSAPSAFDRIKAAAGEEFLKRDRNNPTTWQTMHSVIYDLGDKTMYARTQEGEQESVVGLIVEQ